MKQLNIRIRGKTGVGVEKRLFPKLPGGTQLCWQFSCRFLFFQETLQKHEALNHLELGTSLGTDCGSWNGQVFCRCEIFSCTQQLESRQMQGLRFGSRVPEPRRVTF